jgi:ORF6N domain-containing protein
MRSKPPPGRPLLATSSSSKDVVVLIHFLRGQRVMLDSDLARLYGVETKALNRAVSRNPTRFPVDFMFQLTAAEGRDLRYQSGTSNPTAGRGGRRYRPYAFTEQGVAMLSSVLRSPRAIAVNVEIMRAFVRLRELITSHADLAAKIAKLEMKYDRRFRVVFEAIRQLMEPGQVQSPKPIGFGRS